MASPATSLNIVHLYDAEHYKKDVLFLQQLEPCSKNHVPRTEAGGGGVDVEGGVVNLGVGLLIQEVVKFQLPIDVLRLELGRDVAKPGMAIRLR